MYKTINNKEVVLDDVNLNDTNKVITTKNKSGRNISNTKSIIFCYDVIFVINTQNATPVVMDTEAFINNDEGRMYVPIRFLATAMGYQVDWDEATQTVSLSLAE